MTLKAPAEKNGMSVQKLVVEGEGIVYTLEVSPKLGVVK